MSQGAAGGGGGGNGGARRRIAITGASGLIGRALAQELAAAGQQVTRVVRRRAEAGEVSWDPAGGRIDAAGLEGHDAVVHLAGESLAGDNPFTGRWTAARKRRIQASRVEGTTLLAGALAQLERPPGVLVTASGIGVYGDRDPAEEVTEEAAPGSGFLAELAQAWEGAAAPAVSAGIRVAHARTGVVLDAAGGALPALLPVFRFGLGGRLGDGRQAWSWIALEDTVAAYRHILDTDGLHGPVNVVAPEGVSNREFTRTLARVLRRPAPWVVPAPALRLLVGEMADEMLLTGARAVPARLLASGFRFRYPRLEPALRAALGR
jgi:uncharacterized protein